MKNNVVEKLKEIIYEYEFDDIYEDENELKIFLNEICPNSEHEIKIISLCASIGAPNRLNFNNVYLPPEKNQIKKEINELIKDLKSQYSIKSDNAKWGILSWAYIYSLIPKKILSNNGKKFLEENPKKRTENKKKNEKDLTLEEIKKEISEKRPGLLSKEIEALAQEKKYRSVNDDM
jgi:integrase